MKRICAFMVLFLTLSMVYADGGKFTFEVGDIGAGVRSGTIFYDGFFFGRFATLSYQTEFGLGVTVSPLTFISDIEQTDNFRLTFINGSLFYNVFFMSKMRDYLRLGPFVSINAVNYRDPRFFDFHAGLLFTFYASAFGDSNFFDWSMVGVEAGYKYNHIDKNEFYLQVSTNLIMAVWAIVLGSEKEYREYQKEHPIYQGVH